MKVDIMPAAHAGPPPTRRECKAYADRFGADLPADLYSDEPMLLLRASAYLFGVRDRGVSLGQGDGWL